MHQCNLIDVIMYDACIGCILMSALMVEWLITNKTIIKHTKIYMNGKLEVLML